LILDSLGPWPLTVLIQTSHRRRRRPLLVHKKG
jgi:hypothetical protein